VYNFIAEGKLPPRAPGVSDRAEVRRHQAAARRNHDAIAGLNDRLSGRDIADHVYYVRDTTGESVEVQGLNPDSTIGELKAKLAADTFNEELHILKFKRTGITDDNSTLASIGIRHDMTIITAPRPKAKAKAKGKGKAKSKSISAVGGDAGDIG
jgi:hypothetical protein